MTISAYPLQWPDGWKRTALNARKTAKFRKASRQDYNGTWHSGRELTITEAITRARNELERMRVHDDDLVISSNLELRLDGQPKGAQREPIDPGVAVYWRDKGVMRCMAIDLYDRAADNLAAIAATIEAMRAIERHGGAEILERAFTGFIALPPPESKPWHVVLACPAHASTEHVRRNYMRGRSLFHPDKGGDADQFQALQKAWHQFCAERGIDA